jgi:hypothetical protein
MRDDRATRPRALPVLVAVLALAAGAAAVPAPSGFDARWTAWLGCWSPVDAVPGPASEETHLVCVVPSADGSGVDMATVVDGEVVARERITADGEQRSFQREGCNGWESATWSADGRRVYLRSEFACEGGTRRSSSGLLSFTSTVEWLDIQSVSAAGGPGAVRVLRYRLAPAPAAPASIVEELRMLETRALAVSTARAAAAGPLATADVIDVATSVRSEAVEAWLVERQPQLALNAQRLVTMADAGVPESVIDMVVALAYPSVFAVNDRADYVTDEPSERRARMVYPGYFDPVYWDPFRYGRGYYYSPYGWGSPYGWYPGYRPIIIVAPPTQDQDVRRGRVVNNRGYTRGGRSGDRAPGTGATGASTGSGGSGAATSSDGRSSGSTSTDTGRTAVRRGGS